VTQPSDEEIRDAVSRLESGGVVGLPTETVYGLAAVGDDPKAVASIFAIKGRPTGHPLILHLADASWLTRYAVEVPENAQVLTSRFWPGPLTLILKRSSLVSDAVTGGLETVALRVPGHPVALRVLRELDRPLAAPSANRFGAVSPTTADHVRSDLGSDCEIVLDGGPCDVGLESTILDLTRDPPRLLRPGGITRAELEGALDCEIRLDDGGGPAAPGTLESHYAPSASVVLCESKTIWGEAQKLRNGGTKVAVIGPSPPELGLDGMAHFELPAEATVAAHELYRALRLMDAEGVEVILTAAPAPEGVGVAVADRLKRAAAPRPV